MAVIQPFSGVFYNQSLLKDWTKVICPVYDIIPPGQKEELYQRNEHNFIRLEAGRDLPQDTASDNKYTRSAMTLKQWLARGILERDKDKSLYIHEHYFEYKGGKYFRNGLITRVRLEEWDNRVIRPHESTLAGAKSDRLNLLWAVQANTSSILSLYEDPSQKIKRIIETEKTKQSFLDLPVDGHEGHRVWPIHLDQAEQIASILKDQPLYIADGHHRYESALTYRRQVNQTSNIPKNDHAADFVMMTLVDFDDPGLLILPPHRLVRGIGRVLIDNLLQQLNVFFEITEVSLDSINMWAEHEERARSSDKPTLALFGITPEKVLLLKPISLEILANMMPHFHTELYKQLEVSIIDHVILEKLLALTNDKEQNNLDYCYDRQDAINRVISGEYQLTLLLTSIKPKVIKEIADLGDKMPKKSTYFYPKVPAGLIINILD